MLGKISSGLLAGSVVGLVTAKLAGVISCSWWWVFAPIWLPLMIILSALAGAFVLAMFLAWYDTR